VVLNNEPVVFSRVNGFRLGDDTVKRGDEWFSLGCAGWIGGGVQNYKKYIVVQVIIVSSRRD